MKKFIYMLIIYMIFPILMYSQTTTFDDNYRPFGNYTLADDRYPVHTVSTNCNRSYTPVQSYTPSQASARKAKNSGSGTATSDDGTVTITYTWKWTGIFTYTITFSNGETRTVTASQWLGDDITTKAYDLAKEIANEEAAARHATPIGNFHILIVFCILYLGYKKYCML